MWVARSFQSSSANLLMQGDQIIDAMPGKQPLHELETTLIVFMGTFSETRPKKYEPISSADYLKMRLNATYVK